MTDTSPLVWTEPPGRRQQAQRYDWAAVAQGLRERPGEWALVDRQVRRTIATAIRRGRITAMRSTEEGSFEVRTRQQQGVLADLYVRWLPIGTIPTTEET